MVTPSGGGGDSPAVLKTNVKHCLCVMIVFKCIFEINSDIMWLIGVRNVMISKVLKRF